MVDFEDAFSAPLSLGREIVETGFGLVTALCSESMNLDTRPEATIFRLGLSATANTRAGLVCLRSPETSVAALPLLRGILEAWSHVAFIVGDRGVGGFVYDREAALCRALSYERGAFREWGDAVKGAPGGALDRQRWQATRSANLQMLDVAAQQAGCSDRPRTRGQVRTTLNELAQYETYSWLPHAYKTTSAATHMYTSDYLLRDNGTGESDLVWSLPSYRAGWLVHLAVAFTSVSSTAANGITDQATRTWTLPASQQLHELTGELVEHPSLRRAVELAYDKDPH